MNTDKGLRVNTIAYHRNGISGEPFYVVLFTDKDDDGIERRMMAIVFTPQEPPLRVAVLDTDETAKGNVAFGCGNSWRGDNFAAALWQSINAWEKHRADA